MKTCIRRKEKINNKTDYIATSEKMADTKLYEDNIQEISLGPSSLLMSYIFPELHH